MSDFLEERRYVSVARFWDVGNFRGISCSEVVREMFPKFARVLLPANIDETATQLSRRLPAMTYFYSDDDLRRHCRFHLRFLFRRWRAQAAEVSVSRGVSVRVVDDSIHFPRRRRAPRNANKQVSEPVSQTSKHVVAVSCLLPRRSGSYSNIAEGV